MAVDYDVDGVSFSSINAACTDVEANHNYNTSGIANINVSITTADTTVVTVDGVNVGTPDGTTKYIKIEATSGGHSGHWDATKQRLYPTSGGHAMTINHDYVHLKGLQIRQGSTGSSDECIRLSSGLNNLLIEKSIFQTNNTGSQDCIYAGDFAVTDIAVFDCVITQGGSSARGGIHAQNYQGSASQSWHIEHCTINANGVTATNAGGIVSNDASSGTNTINVDNVISFGSASSANDYQQDSGTSTWSGQGNLGSDTSCTAELGATNNQNSKVVDADNDSGTDVQITVVDADYQIIDGADNGAAIDNAISGATQDSRIDLTLDIAGNARPGTYTDRDSGAFEVAAAVGGGAYSPSIELYYRHLLAGHA